MSRINGEKVIIAQLNAAMFIPGIGTLPQELSSTQNAVDRAISMVVDEPFLLCQVEGKTNRRMYDIAIPLENVKSLVLASEAITTPPLK